MLGGEVERFEGYVTVVIDVMFIDEHKFRVNL